MPGAVLLAAGSAEQGKSLINQLHLIKYNIDVDFVLSGKVNKTSLEPFGALFLIIAQRQAPQLQLRQCRQRQHHGAPGPQAPVVKLLPDRIKDGETRLHGYPMGMTHDLVSEMKKLISP